MWATAATAMHNILTLADDDLPPRRDANSRRFEGGKLTLDDDPLTYLGILADTLQEWDRYTLSRDGMFGARTPLLSSETGLSFKDGKVVVAYDTEDRTARVKEALDRNLDGWTNVVEIKAPQPTVIRLSSRNAVP